MSKKITSYIKLTIPAGKATPAPPIGPALGQRQLNIMEFCKAFNAATQNMEASTPVPVVITAFEDKSFTFITKTPPASYYLKKFANVEKGSKAPKKEGVIGRVKESDLLEIARIKMADLNANDLEAAAKMIRGSAESMGIEIIVG